MHNKSRQEVFDHVVHHFQKQQAPGMSGKEGCAYYDPKTSNKCGVGCLLSDEDAKSLRNESIDEIWDDFLTLKSAQGLRMHFELLDAIQEVHDCSTNFYEMKKKFKLPETFNSQHPQFNEYFMKDFDERLLSVATRFGLKYQRGEVLKKKGKNE